MADDDFREIQLGSKQLVFSFMVGAVVLVVTFLLGVMVGRGVRSATGDAAGTTASTTSDTALTADAPPPSGSSTPTKPSPGELDYAAMLEGKDPKKVTEPPATPADAPGPAGAAKPTAATPVTTPPLEPSKNPPKDLSSKSAPAPASATIPASDAWFVQVIASKSKSIAEDVVKKLKGKGFQAFLYEPSDNVPTALFRVRVGPFPLKADADRAKAALQREGYRPDVMKGSGR